eukprot:1067336-Rhodomonas_salina.2
MESFLRDYKEEYAKEYWKTDFDYLNGTYANLVSLESPLDSPSSADIQHVHDVVDHFVFLLHEKTTASLNAFYGTHLLSITILKTEDLKLKRSIRKKLEEFRPHYLFTSHFVSEAERQEGGVFSIAQRNGTSVACLSYSGCFIPKWRKML